MDKIPVHYHNGIDSNPLSIKDIVTQQSTITPPSGGTVIDIEARATLNDIITKLQTLELTK